VPSRQTGQIVIPLTAGAAGLAIVTADVSFDKWDLREWLEALVNVV
jgi:hypothetical protein